MLSPTTHFYYHDVIMSAMVSQITSLTIVYSTVYSGADQRTHQSPASLAFVRGIHRWPVNSPHKGPVTRTMFPFDDIIMSDCIWRLFMCLDFRGNKAINIKTHMKRMYTHWENCFISRSALSLIKEDLYCLKYKLCLCYNLIGFRDSSCFMRVIFLCD